MRLVDPDGQQIGVQKIEAARYLAAELGLDLVEVAPDARPPVVRMMDYGKYKYEQSVKAREARKKQTRTVVKEVQFRPKIGDSDFIIKQKRIERFLDEGDKVKVTMRFRGREVTHPELGQVILVKLADLVAERGVVETMPRLDGRQMTMVLAPAKRPRRSTSDGERTHPTETAEATPSVAESTADAGPEMAGAGGEEESDGEGTPPTETAMETPPIEESTADAGPEMAGEGGEEE